MDTQNYDPRNTAQLDTRNASPGAARVIPANNTGVSTPQDNGNVRTLSPAQPLQQVQQASTGGLQPAVRPGGLQPAVMPGNVGGASLQPAIPAAGSTPLLPAAKPDMRNVVIRDMNGTPAGVAPRDVTQALRPGIARTLAAGIGTGSASGSVQPAAMPYRPGVPLGTQQTQRVQAYNSSPGPAQYVASQTSPATDPTNPDPNASLRPGGSSSLMPVIPPGAPQQVQAPSQLDQDQAKLANYTNTGPGVSQIKNPVARAALRTLDVAGSIFAPGVAAQLPGTTLHNQQLIGRQQQVVANDQAQQQAVAQLADTQSQTQERQALADKADKYDPNITKTVTTADGVMAFNPSTGRYDNRVGDAPDKLNKYQIITAGDGTMFRVDPSDPTHAEPITGPDGKQLTGKQESKYIQLERGGVEHTIEIGAGGKQTDLGPTGQKPMRVSVNGGGTWALDEDKNGKPILFNSKTGETKDAPDVQKAGTAAKAQAAIDKVNEPVDAAMNYANDYLTRGTYTGSGDEALQEKFFELAKPSVGFRMTQPQIDLLQNSRSWINSAAAHLRHATTGTWFSDTQRKEIVQTMKDLGAAKKKSGGASQLAPSSKSGFDWGSHPKVQP
jgi:hypothetical protein